MAEERKRELALAPGTYAYVLDNTKGGIKTHVGPTVINQSGQDRPVVFNQRTHKFDECSLEEAVQQVAVVPEGFYAVLTNPAKSKDSKLMFPETGRAQDTAELSIGLKENVPGPVNFALYPGQTCEVRRGHHLRSNEYLRIKIYNEDKAKDNWSKAIIKSADTVTTTPSAPTAAAIVARHAPADLAVGKQYNILGTDVAFYIPPTGVSVMPEAFDETTNKAIFVRQAETLEQLEYSILVDEDGNKEYPKGPCVVFPRPTQEFVTLRQRGQEVLDNDGLPIRKFRAVEMNELQGIQLKFMKDVQLTWADGSKHQYKAGDEVFITGKEMPIYYPEEGHQLVTYDGKTLHYATQVTEGEGKYVLDRKTGVVALITGPKMLLPNPVLQTIVYRPLSDRESKTWFPGSDGTGSKEAIEWNSYLRSQLQTTPTTRSGVVSEGVMKALSLSGDDGPQASMAYSMTNQFSGSEAGTPVAAVAGVASPARQRKPASSTHMDQSRQGKNQNAVFGDTAERKSTFNEPRTLILGSKLRGVPTINIYPGYAVSVINTDGSRKVEVGPKIVLLEFGQKLDTLRLSTGKPKTTDKIFETAYLNVHNNKITDYIEAETVDHVVVQLRLSYNVSFEGDVQKWFSIENYVKHMCDHIRSILKGKIRKLPIEEFYSASTDVLRDIILGVSTKEEGKPSKNRPGLSFPENGMKVTDVEVLGVSISDPTIGRLLAETQHKTIQQNIALNQAEKQLVLTKRQEELTREDIDAKFQTEKHRFTVESEKVDLKKNNDIALLAAEVEKLTEQKAVEETKQAINDFTHAASLLRQKSAQEQEIFFSKEAQDLELQSVERHAKAIEKQMNSISPQLVAALEQHGARDLLVQVAKSLSFHEMFGAGNAAELIQKTFANTPLQALITKSLDVAGRLGNGHSEHPVVTPTA